METRTYRAAPAAYVTFGAITGALSVLWLVAVWRVGAPRAALFVPLAGFLVVALWLSRFRVTFGLEEIVLAVPLRGRRHLARKEILTVELDDASDRPGAPLTLCIRTSFGEELRLNAKVFSTEAIECLLSLSNQPKRPRPAAAR